MNVLVVLRAEFACLIIMVYLYIAGNYFDVGKYKEDFKRIWIFATGHLVFDIITVYTANNTDIVPDVLNHLLHVIFYLLGLAFAMEFFCYTVKNSVGVKEQAAARTFSNVIFMLYLTAVPFLSFKFEKGDSVCFSCGIAPHAAYASGMFFMILSALVLFFNREKYDRYTKMCLIPVLFIVILVEMIQVVFEEVLFTGCSITIVTVSLFFALENPEYALSRKSIKDVFTGLKSRNSFEIDIKAIDHDYRAGKFEKRDLAFVYCDINGLKLVNDRFGHAAGDEYIKLVSNILTENMKSAEGLYRMGGDEFMAVYINVREEVIKSEIQAVNDHRDRVKERYPFKVGIALGYEMASPEHKDIKDIMQAADYNMYQNKWKMKKTAATTSSDENIVDKSGLEDNRIFEMFSILDSTHFLYAYNFRTRAARLSENSLSYFGFQHEYMYDTDTLWEKMIHPDDRNEFRKDVDNLISGRKKMHDIECRVMNHEKKYVKCLCRGMIVKAQDGENDLLAGIIQVKDAADVYHTEETDI